MPRVQMTPTVKVTLWALSVYLVVLFVLLAVRFVQAFR
jgi:TRAP-type C4-dicarboxylate transport system permease small subunit